MDNAIKSKGHRRVQVCIDSVMNKTLIYKCLVLLFGLSSLMGVNIVVNPAALDMLYKLEILDTDTDIWLKADLGGYVFSGGVLLLMGVLQNRGVWIHAVAISIGCIFVARLYGVAVHGLSLTQALALLLEAAMILVFTLAGRHLNQLGADKEQRTT